MRKSIGLAVLATLTLAAPAAAAPDHTFNGGLEKETFDWTSLPGTGLSDVKAQAGCNEGVNCDQMLFEVKEAGILTIKTVGNEPTLIDGDFEIFTSDAEGTEGDVVAATTAFSPNENVPIDVEPGFYLMNWYYSGFGSYDGAASWEPLPPPDEEIPEDEL